MGWRELGVAFSVGIKYHLLNVVHGRRVVNNLGSSHPPWGAATPSQARVECEAAVYTIAAPAVPAGGTFTTWCNKQ
jgi:hypothetical protein